jgi:hypothetical protein
VAHGHRGVQEVASGIHLPTRAARAGHEAALDFESRQFWAGAPQGGEATHRRIGQLTGAAQAAQKGEVTMNTVMEKAVAQVVKAASAFHDPTDVLSFVNAGDFVDDEGKIDVDGISAAVAEVAKDKPHLVKSRPRTKQPTVDGGGRGGPSKDDMVAHRLARIRETTGIS